MFWVSLVEYILKNKAKLMGHKYIFLINMYIFIIFCTYS